MKKSQNVLWLTWCNQETEQTYHVGNLVQHQDGTYSFFYELSKEPKKLKEAMENGYKPHLSFRDVEKTYFSDRLFGPFSRRLPDNRRQDFNEILRSYNLTSDYTEMDLLCATGGRLATDPYEFVAPREI